VRRLPRPGRPCNPKLRPFGQETVGRMPSAKSVATTRQSVTPSESAEASHRIGGPMIAGSSIPARTSSPTSSGIHSGEQEIPGDIGREQITESVGLHDPERLRVCHESGIDRSHPDAGVVHEHIDSSERAPRRSNAVGRAGKTCREDVPGRRAGKTCRPRGATVQRRQVRTTALPRQTGLDGASQIVWEDVLLREILRRRASKPEGIIAIGVARSRPVRDAGAAREPEAPER